MLFHNSFFSPSQKRTFQHEAPWLHQTVALDSILLRSRADVKQGQNLRHASLFDTLFLRVRKLVYSRGYRSTQF